MFKFNYYFIVIILLLISCSSNDDVDGDLNEPISEPTPEIGTEILVANTYEVFSINSVSGNKSVITNVPNYYEETDRFFYYETVNTDTYIMDGDLIYAQYKSTNWHLPSDKKLIIIDINSGEITFQDIVLPNTIFPFESSSMIQDQNYIYTLVLEEHSIYKIIRIDKVDFSTDIYFENFDNDDFKINLMAIENEFIYFKTESESGRYLKKLNINTFQEETIYNADTSFIDLNKLELLDSSLDEFICVSGYYATNGPTELHTALSKLKDNTLNNIYYKAYGTDFFDDWFFFYNFPSYGWIDCSYSFLDKINDKYYLTGTRSNYQILNGRRTRESFDLGIYTVDIANGDIEFTVYDSNVDSSRVSDWYILGTRSGL